MLNSSQSHFPWGFWRLLQNLSSIMTCARKPTCVQLRDRRRLNSDSSLRLALASLSLASLGPWASFLAPQHLTFLVWKMGVITAASSQG